MAQAEAGQQPFPFLFAGGLDVITPPIAMKPGSLIAGYNYESQVGGYGRIDGLERFDGRPKPSEASYWVLAFDGGTAGIVTGNTVTGLTSGATGYALIDAVVTSGTYVGTNAAGYLVLSEITGAFVDNENLRVGGVNKSVSNGLAIQGGAVTLTDGDTWTALAIEHRRSAITAPPGSSGAYRGVHTYKGDKYTFRDVGAAGGMFKATPAGWVLQSLGRSVPFTSGGTYVIAEGNTITGATSAATGVVGRVILTAGDWGAGTAAGRLILTSQTGNFVAENLNVGANLNVATIAANSTANALPAGGRYTIRNHNFFGQASTLRMYGANGVGTAFEWDGTVFTPLISGVTPDTPTYLDIESEHLMLGFENGSIVTSEPGNPYGYTALGGASEIAVGFKLTGLLASVAGAMVVFGETAISILYGSSVDDWDLKGLTDESGARAYTAQMIGSPHYLDNLGIRNLTTTQAFGNFSVGSVTDKIQPLFEVKRKAGALPVASIRVRKKTQYRLFYSDGTGINVFFGRKYPESTLFDLNLVVQCATSGEDSLGNEELYIGADDGFVHQLDSGTSLDGDEVAAFARLAFVNCKSPQVEKRFHGAKAELSVPTRTELAMTAMFDYGNPDLSAVPERAFMVIGGGGIWDESTWDDFTWDAAVAGTVNARFSGKGANVSVVIMSEDTYRPPHVLQAMTIMHSPRRLKR